jgi:hypothetical protein
MFRAPLCPSSGAREYYTVSCRLWSLVLGFQVVGMAWAAALLSSTPYRQLENLAPNTTGGNQLYNTLELLMMDILFSHFIVKLFIAVCFKSWCKLPEDGDYFETCRILGDRNGRNVR